MNRLDLSGYEVVRAQYFATLQNPAMTISNGKLRFNTACLKKFEDVLVMFYRFGMIDVPDEVKGKMGHPKNCKK